MEKEKFKKLKRNLSKNKSKKIKKVMIGTAKIRQSKAPSMTLKNLPKTSAGKTNSVETEMIHKVKRKTRKRQKNKPKSKSNQAKKNKSQMI